MKKPITTRLFYDTKNHRLGAILDHSDDTLCIHWVNLAGGAKNRSKPNEWTQQGFSLSSFNERWESGQYTDQVSMGEVTQ